MLMLRNVALLARELSNMDGFQPVESSTTLTNKIWITGFRTALMLFSVVTALLGVYHFRRAILYEVPIILNRLIRLIQPCTVHVSVLPVIGVRVKP